MLLKFHLKLIQRNHADAYRQLILKSHANAKSFSIRPAVAEWNEADEICFPLGIFQNKKLISCMRLEPISDLSSLNYRLKSKFTLSNRYLPAAYLSKAGTLPEYCNLGLNTLLRLVAFQMCETWQIQTVFGKMMANSPRVQTMKKMGYTFKASRSKWNGSYTSSAPPLLAMLDLKTKAPSAFRYMNEHCKELLTQTKIDPRIFELSPKSPAQIKSLILTYQSPVQSI